MAAHCFDATTFVGPCNHKARGQHHNPPAPGRSHYLKIKRKQVCNKFFIGIETNTYYPYYPVIGSDVRGGKKILGRQADG